MNDWFTLILASIMSVMMLFKNRIKISKSDLIRYIILVFLFAIVALTFTETKNIVRPFFYLIPCVALCCICKSSDIYYKTTLYIVLFFFFYIIVSNNILFSFFNRQYNCDVFLNYVGSVNRIVVGIGTLFLINIIKYNNLKINFLFVCLGLYTFLIFGNRLSLLITFLSLYYQFGFLRFNSRITAFLILLITVIYYMIYFDKFDELVYWRLSAIFEFRDLRYIAFFQHLESFKNELDFIFGQPNFYAMTFSNFTLDNFFSFVFLSYGFLGLIIISILLLIHFYTFKNILKSNLVIIFWIFIVLSLDESIPKVEFLSLVFLPKFLINRND